MSALRGHRRVQRARRRRLRRRPRDHARDHALGGQAHPQRHRVLRRGPRRRGRRQRRRHRGRLPLGLDVPGLRRPDVPVRLRRLDHRPRGLPVVPARALSARRADAQRRQVHRRRRARVPAAGASRACGHGDQHAAHLGHLPRRAARRRGRRDRGAGRHPIRLRRAHLRRVHGRLRRLRRHAGHDLGPDHQGLHADDRRRRRSGRRHGQVQLQPGPTARHGRLQSRGGPEHPRPGHVPDVAAADHLDRPDDLHRHRRPAAHPDAVLHRPGLQGRADVGPLHDRHHRLVHRARDDHRLRRAGAARPGRRQRRSARAATSPRRCWRSSWAAARARPAAPSRSRCSRRPRSRRSSPSWRGS